MDSRWGGEHVAGLGDAKICPWGLDGSGVVGTGPGLGDWMALV